MAKEKWIDVIKFEGIYQISSFGRVRSLPRITAHSRKISGRILKPRPTKTGYLRVQLHDNGIAKDFYIHRLVAIYFVDNTNNYNEVNHIDGIKSNNFDLNLEWCDRSMNMVHSYNKLNNKKGCFPIKSVLGINLESGKKLYFISISNAEKWLRNNGYPKALHGNICSVCNSKCKYAYGHTWEYTEVIK